MSDSVDAVELSRARQSRLRRCLMLEFLRRKIPSGTSAERTQTTTERFYAEMDSSRAQENALKFG